jgi:hypothetical protein
LGGWYYSSDRFWGNLNDGLTVKDAFITNVWTEERWHLWLDDNGDSIGHPPDNLANDGALASATTIGAVDIEDLELTAWYSVWIHSAGELRVHDSQGRVTGLINGVVKEEIPNSIYDEDSEVVAIFSLTDTYHHEVVGTEEGTYGLDIASIRAGKVTTFNAINIPTLPNEVHQYTIDWATLSQGEEGVTVQVDAGGDGTVEHTFTADSDLSQEEYLSATKGISIESSDASGGVKDTFLEAESVYVTGSGYAASATYDVYIMSDQTWSGGESLAGYVIATTVTTDGSGNIPVGTLIWSSSFVGKYDIVVDTNGNGVYDEAVDPLDDMDVNDAGFETVPKFTTIALPVAAIFGLFVLIRRRKHH